jgi:hypothetical protein
MSLYSYQFVSRTMVNRHTLPDSSNFVLNFCLLRRFPTADSVTRHVIGSKDWRMSDRKSLASKITRHDMDTVIVSCHRSTRLVTRIPSGFGGLGVSALAFGTQVRGFKPGRSRRIFSGRKNPQRAFLRKVSKTVSPMSLIYGM